VDRKKLARDAARREERDADEDRAPAFGEPLAHLPPRHLLAPLEIAADRLRHARRFRIVDGKLDRHRQRRVGRLLFRARDDVGDRRRVEVLVVERGRIEALEELADRVQAKVDRGGHGTTPLPAPTAVPDASQKPRLAMRS
jgi:hypothetical protein